MDLDAVKRSLELDPSSSPSVSSAAKLPPSLYDAFVLHGLRIDAAEPRRVLCSLSVPPRLANSESYLHGGVIATFADVVGSAVFYSSGFPTSGVSLEINVSYFDAAFINKIYVSSGLSIQRLNRHFQRVYMEFNEKEEIEIEAKLLQVGKAVGVTSIEFRKKNTGKIIAQARHTKYLVVSSKL